MFITSEWADITLQHAVNSTTYVKCPVLLTSHVGCSSRRSINLHVFSLNHIGTLKIWLTSHTITYRVSELKWSQLGTEFRNAKSWLWRHNRPVKVDAYKCLSLASSFVDKTIRPIVNTFNIHLNVQPSLVLPCNSSHSDANAEVSKPSTEGRSSLVCNEEIFVTKHVWVHRRNDRKLEFNLTCKSSVPTAQKSLRPHRRNRTVNAV